MNLQPMKLLIIEDDVDDCNKFIECVNKRDDFKIVALTDSDIEALGLIKTKRPEGIILDLELNSGHSGNAEALDFMDELKNLKLDYNPIVIVTTHVNSKRVYKMLHESNVDLILYKDHPCYSCDYVLNVFSKFRRESKGTTVTQISDELKESQNKVSEYIYNELDLIGITSKLKGREYIHDAILYLIENGNSGTNVIRYITKIHKKSESTINNGIQNAIIHAWRRSSIEDLTKLYTARINYETGVPTPMEFIYYYTDKIKKLI